MRIETIDLRLPRQVPSWIWYLNGLLVLALTLIMLLPDIWPKSSDDAIDVPEAAAPAVPTTSQAATVATPPKMPDWNNVLAGLEKNQIAGTVMENFTVDAVSHNMRLTLSFDTYEHLARYMDSQHLKGIQLPCRLESAEVLAEMGSVGLPGKAVVSCKQ